MPGRLPTPILRCRACSLAFLPLRAQITQAVLYPQVAGRNPTQCFQKKSYSDGKASHGSSQLDGDTRRGYTFSASYLESLRSLIQQNSTPWSLEEIQRISEEVQKIAHDLSTREDTPARRFNLEFVASIVAPYRAMKASGMQPSQIRELLEQALSRTMEPMSRQLRQQLDSSSDVFSLLVTESRDKEVNFFGPDFKFRRARDSSSEYHLEVHKCWYMEMLDKLGAREIGSVFCAFDKSWYEQIDPSKDKMKFTRPSTIAGGADRCRFNFDRV